MNKSKCALLIGCNYANTTNPIKGCTVDVIQMKGILIDAYQYNINNITLLRDDDPLNLPTKESILFNLNKIISSSYNYSEIFVYYSGHGSEIILNNKNNDGSEIILNNDNTIIVPCDYKQNDTILSTDFYNIIEYVQCPLKIILDSKIQGFKLQYQYNTSPKINMTLTNPVIINQLITVYSRIDNNKMSDIIINLIRENNYSLKYSDILYTVKNSILYSSQQLNLTSNFMNYLYHNYSLLVETIKNNKK
jgi:hypothetical protein